MTDNTELRRLVDRVLTDRRFCGDENHKALADGVNALIAENERLLKLLERTVEQHVPLTELEGVPGWSRVVELVEVVAERDHLALCARQWEEAAMQWGAERDQLKAENERQAAQFKKWQASHHANYCQVAEERDQLRAEVAGLKTGYEAYERVNAELKADNEALRKDAEQWRALVGRAKSPLIGYTGCVICGVFTDHGGLPCPKTRATVDAALGQGEQS